MTAHSMTMANRYLNWQPSMTNKLALTTFGVMPPESRQALLRDCRAIDKSLTSSVMHGCRWPAVTPLHFLELFRRFVENGHAIEFMRRLYARLKANQVALKRIRTLLAKSAMWIALKSLVKFVLVKVLGIGALVGNALKYLYDLIRGCRLLS